jgi:hypothetical protein
MDKLKKYLDENREGLDDAEPSGEVWDRIEGSLNVKRPRHFTIRDIYKWSAAAAIFFVTITCVYFILIRKDKPNEPVATTNTSAPTRPSYAEEIAGMDPAYATQAKNVYNTILRQQDELRILSVKQPELYGKFSSDLHGLDSSYGLLRKKVAQLPDQDVLIEAMLQNLQLQAELLSKQLFIIKELQHKKNSNEKTSYPGI